MVSPLTEIHSHCFGEPCGEVAQTFYPFYRSKMFKRFHLRYSQRHQRNYFHLTNKLASFHKDCWFSAFSFGRPLHCTKKFQSRDLRLYFDWLSKSVFSFCRFDIFQFFGDLWQINPKFYIFKTFTDIYISVVSRRDQTNIVYKQKIRGRKSNVPFQFSNKRDACKHPFTCILF